MYPSPSCTESLAPWNGSVCPVSGDTLDRDDLVVDTKLQTEIAEYRIRQSLGAAEGGGGSDDDLYNF